MSRVVHSLHSHGAPRCPPKSAQAPRREATCRIPPSALSSRESSPARSSLQSEHLRRFLSYIVEQSLAGQGHSLKESVLAHELYGKGTDFDGGTDAVVRVDARRLRDKLREFYEGKSDPIVISLPKGSYVPVFEENSASLTQTTRPVALTEFQERRPVTHLRRARVWVGALALVTVLLTALLVWRALRGPANAPGQLLPLASYPGQ